MNGKKGGSIGKTPAKGTFIVGEAGPGKLPLGGKINKGSLREKPGKNQGTMPKSM